MSTDRHDLLPPLQSEEAFTQLLDNMEAYEHGMYDRPLLSKTIKNFDLHPLLAETSKLGDTVECRIEGDDREHFYDFVLVGKGFRNVLKARRMHGFRLMRHYNDSTLDYGLTVHDGPVSYFKSFGLMYDMSRVRPSTTEVSNALVVSLEASLVKESPVHLIRPLEDYLRKQDQARPND